MADPFLPPTILPKHFLTKPGLGRVGVGMWILTSLPLPSRWREWELEPTFRELDPTSRLPSFSSSSSPISSRKRLTRAFNGRGPDFSLRSAAAISPVMLGALKREKSDLSESTDDLEERELP